MKKIILVLALVLATAGVFAQEVKRGSSIGYMWLSDMKIIGTKVEGGDGYYSRFIMSDEGKVVYYFTQFKDNKLVWAFTEIGKLENITSTTENTFRFTVNGNKYIQGFIRENGANFLWITAIEMAGGDGISFIYELD